MFFRTESLFRAADKYTRANADECYQGVYIYCRDSSFTNIVGKFRSINNRTMNSFEENSQCFRQKDIKCNCAENSVATHKGSILFGSKDLPLKEICVRKLRNGDPGSYISILSYSMTCYAKKNHFSMIKGVNKIIDKNLESCSSNVDWNELKIMKPLTSSLKVNVWIKLKEKSYDCKLITIFKEKINNCGKPLKQKCQFTNDENSDRFPYKLCSYVCDSGVIDKISILKKMQETTNNDIEICEVTTLHLEN